MKAVPRITWIVLLVALGALPVLGWLQLGWTRDASQAQVYQQRERLASAGSRVASALELNRIVLREYVHDLRIGSRNNRLTPNQAVEQALAFWKSSTRTPRILKRIWLVSPGHATFLDPDGIWHQGQWSDVPDDIRDLTEVMDRGDRRPDPEVLTRIFFPAEPVQFQPFLLMVPEADMNAVASDLLPDILHQAFGNGQDSEELSFVVRDRSGGVVFQEGPSPSQGTPPEVRISLWSESPKKSPNAAANPILRLWLNKGGVEEVARWTLEVSYSKGTIEELSQRMRWMNLSVSLVLLGLLAGALVVLFALYRRSRRMVHSQNAFVASVSHELRTPLAVLRGAAENLKEGLVTQPEQAVRYGSRILEESDRLLQLTENVLSYARIGSQRVELGTKNWDDPIDLTELARHASESWHEAFHQAGATLVGPVRDQPAPVRGDKGALKAIFDNLLSNALRYGTRPDGTVSVEIARRDNSWTLTVRDDGPGIPHRERKRVFEPFYRASTQKTGGIGLGLSLVQKISEAHGGSVRILPGKGASIEVTLPAFEET